MVSTDTRIEIITSPEIERLQDFVANAGNIAKSFRYFDKRPFSIIENHIVTAIMLFQDRSIGYGHLDKDEDTIWLGIAISESFQGNGLGKIMIQFLMNHAKRINIDSISLTVDEDNTKAVKLYNQFGFAFKKNINRTTLLMEWRA